MLSDKEKPHKDASTMLKLDDHKGNQAYITNIFLDILYQDDDGNSALMLAVAEHRFLHVERILRVASERGKLFQVMNMQNVEGLTAIQIAYRVGSEKSAKIIRRIATEYKKSMHQSCNLTFMRSSNETNENDITVEFNDTSSSDKINRHRFVLEHSSARQSPSKLLLRSKINRDLKRVPSMNYIVKMDDISKSQDAMPIERRLSGDSITLPFSSSSMTCIDGGKKSVGDKLRSIFKMDSKSLLSCRPMEYKKINNEHSSSAQLKPSSVRFFTDQKTSTDTFHSPWQDNERSTYLPPLANLRRRATSETRGKPLPDR